MAANKSCTACKNLQKHSADFVVNGVTDTVEASLKSDTGFNPSSGHNDCTDLNDANDCLIGNMEDEVDAYEVCDWKSFMVDFIHNLWSVLKSIISAICGLWTLAEKNECKINYLAQGASFNFSEFTSTGASYIVAGRGISFANVSASGTANDLWLIYVAGGTGWLGGSLMFYTSDFTDAKSVSNYDNHGVNPTTSASRKGNSKWGDTGYLLAGGELLYEIRLKKSQYPQIDRLFSSHIAQSAGTPFTGEIRVFPEGQYAYGQSGWCNQETGVAQTSSSDTGHLVPTGWIYIQARMKSPEAALGSSDGTQHTPYGIIPMRINQGAIDC